MNSLQGVNAPIRYQNTADQSEHLDRWLLHIACKKSDHFFKDDLDLLFSPSTLL